MKNFGLLSLGKRGIGGLNTIDSDENSVKAPDEKPPTE